MRSRRIFRLTALSAALALAYGAARAQEVEIAELARPESVVSVGLGYWNSDRPQQGIYDGMNREGFYGLLDAFIRRRDDATGTWFTLDARNLGLDTRELRAEWLRQGNLGLSLEYNRTPRDNPYTFLTAVSGLDTTTQRVPTPSAAAAALGEVHLGTVREATTAGIYKSLWAGADLRVTFKNEDKEGTRHWGRGGAAEFAAEPIDSNTKQLEAVLSYVSKAFQIQGGYYGSWYTNRNSLVDTANINAAGVLSNQFFLSLPLDNEAHQFYLDGGYNFTERTRATFKLAYTRATQNEQIPVGAGVPVFAGAPTHLDARVDTTLIQLGLGSRATQSFSWVASLRNYDSDEKTQQYRIVQPAGGCGTCVDNTPLGFKTLTGKLEGTYRVVAGTSLIGGLEYSDQDRKVPLGNLNAGGLDAQRYVPWRAALEELTYRLQVRRSLSDVLNGSLAYAHSKRDGPDFTPAAADAPQSNLINPIHIADRERDKVRLMLDWTPVEPLTLTFNAEYAKDEYGYSDARPYGLRDGTAQVYSIDAAYSFNEQWQMNAWYTRDSAQARQVGQRNANGGAAEAVKDAQLEDTGDTFGAGLKGVLAPRLKVGADLLYSKNLSRYPETLTLLGAGAAYPNAAPGTVGPLPDIQNKLTRFKLYASYTLQKHSEVRVDYIREQWQTDDWSWLFANGTAFTYGTTTDGTQVRQAPKQTADFFGVRYIYRFQ